MVLNAPRPCSVAVLRAIIPRFVEVQEELTDELVPPRENTTIKGGAGAFYRVSHDEFECTKAEMPDSALRYGLRIVC